MENKMNKEHSNKKQKLFDVAEDEWQKNYKILGVKFHIRKNNPKKLIEYIDSRLEKIVPHTQLRLGVDIVDHCNLNCKGCDHFSPVAKEKFLDIKSFEKDVERLSVLTDKGFYIDEFSLLGGEPLLHPQIDEFLRISRNLLPFAKNIFIITNAILLPSMGQEFWTACKNNSITILITKYPVKIDYEKIEEIAANNGVKIHYFNDKEVQKTSYKIPLDLEGKQDARKNFLNCHHANFCIQLKDGRIYTCTVAPSINHFNQYFNCDVPLCENDSIDIYKANSLQEILNFISHPIPFCAYCNVAGRSYGNEWGISKKEITEWV